MDCDAELSIALATWKGKFGVNWVAGSFATVAELTYLASAGTIEVETWGSRQQGTALPPCRAKVQELF